jgi:hypothetical protein
MGQPRKRSGSVDLLLVCVDVIDLDGSVGSSDLIRLCDLIQASTHKVEQNASGINKVLNIKVANLKTDTSFLHNNTLIKLDCCMHYLLFICISILITEYKIQI